MKPQVDLFVTRGSATGVIWELGRVYTLPERVEDARGAVLEYLSGAEAEAILFWDMNLGAPAPAAILGTLKSAGDVWHAGLLLGTAGEPGIIDFIQPTWMLNVDAPGDRVSTSWRLSLRAALIPLRILRAHGWVRPEFMSLDAAALELGFRYFSAGALVRHAPVLIGEGDAKRPALRFSDEMTFARCCFSRTWATYACVRAVASGYVSAWTAFNAWQNTASVTRGSKRQPDRCDDERQELLEHQPRVSVLIPTVDRYPFLEVLLDQLRTQTVTPFEIVVIDQTRKDRRITLKSKFTDLPLQVIEQDEPGQCSSRNAGLQVCSGSHILFLDDDDEVQPDLIERHLRSLARYRADVSCGVADEVGAGPLPEHFRRIRATDVFPTNNAMVTRESLRTSGLFDLAYNRGQRADRDLGMRLYLSGALMVLNPEISVLHHHAPSGGLRTHKARVITYASSRKSLTQLQIPSATEFYLERRYFTRNQVRESMWIRVLSTFGGGGGVFRKLAKMLTATALLPDTIRKVRKNYVQATDMLSKYPKISSFPGDGRGVESAGVLSETTR